MIIWILYLVIESNTTMEHPYHFAFKETCEKMGKELVKSYKYEKFRCVQEKIDNDK
jgi:hypothetical protein